MSFEDAAARVKTLNGTPSNDELLELYALYKQATVGDNTTEAPGFFDMKGKAKWNAWNGKKGVDGESAKQQYIALVDQLVAKLGTK